MATADQKDAKALGDRALALADQLGYIVGTIEGAAKSKMDRKKLADQLTRVRDSAAHMLEGLTDGASKGRKSVQRMGLRPAGGQKKTASAPASLKADPSRAPGKRRRKPAPTLRGVKKSDQRIPKVKVAAVVRQRRKTYA
jgi:hypothetical protein